MLKQVKIENLQVGMMVSAVLAQNGPMKIKKVGMIRSDDMIKGLREMGVQVLEIDTEQSIAMQDDEADSEQESVLTPTQQLMKNDKNVALADRALSQHFHRSMFVPAADSLPSFWQRKGQHLAITFSCAVIGVSLGFVSTLTMLKDDPLPIEQPTSTAIMPEVDSEPVVAIEPKAEAPKAETPIVPETKAEPEAESIAEPEPEPVAESEELKPEDNLPRITSAPNQTLIADDTAQTDNAISAELLAKFNQAVAELEQKSAANAPEPEGTSQDYDVPRVDQLSVSLLTQLPSMAFSAHMYATERDNRWVRVNGKRLQEQDYIADDLQIVNIEPQRVILSFRGEVFSMNALTDW